MPIKDEELDSKSPLYEFGTNIPVDLEILIENVYIAPTSPNWFKELIISVLKNYKLNLEVTQSTLCHNPFKKKEINIKLFLLINITSVKIQSTMQVINI